MGNRARPFVMSVQIGTRSNEWEAHHITRRGDTIYIWYRAVQGNAQMILRSSARPPQVLVAISPQLPDDVKQRLSTWLNHDTSSVKEDMRVRLSDEEKLARRAKTRAKLGLKP